MRITCPNPDCAHTFTYDDAATAIARLASLPVVADCPGPTGDYAQTHLVVSIPHSCGHFTSYTTTWAQWGAECDSVPACYALAREMHRPCPACAPGTHAS